MNNTRFYAREYKKNTNLKRCTWVVRYKSVGEEDSFGITEYFGCILRKNDILPVAIVTPLSWRDGKCLPHPTYKKTWICKTNQINRQNTTKITIPVSSLLYPTLILQLNEKLNDIPMTHIVEYVYRINLNKSNM